MSSESVSNGTAMLPGEFTRAASHALDVASSRLVETLSCPTPSVWSVCGVVLKRAHLSAGNVVRAATVCFTLRSVTASAAGAHTAFSAGSVGRLSGALISVALEEDGSVVSGGSVCGSVVCASINVLSLGK